LHEITRFLPGIGAGRTSSPRCHWPEEGYLPALIMAIQLLTDVELGYDRSNTHLPGRKKRMADTDPDVTDSRRPGDAPLRRRDRPRPAYRANPMVMLLLAIVSALGTILLAILIFLAWDDIVAGNFELHGRGKGLGAFAASPVFLVVFVIEFKKALAARRADGLLSRWWVV
jgi:hypothetical protein